MWDGIPMEEVPKDWHQISTPDRFETILSIIQKNVYGDINLEEIVKNSITVEGKEKQKTRQKIEAELKKHLAEIDPNKKYISFGTSLESYNSNKIEPIQNTPYIKPKGGLWACEYSDTPYEHSEWEKYCREEDYLTDTDYLEKGIEFSLDENSKLLRIETQEDIEYLMSKFSMTKNYLTIDFEKISRLYDGAMISEEAQMMIDYYNLVNPKAMPKPFCVPGIVVFSNEIIKDVKEYDYEVENETPNKITATSAVKNALAETTQRDVDNARANEKDKGDNTYDER